MSEKFYYSSDPLGFVSAWLPKADRIRRTRHLGGESVLRLLAWGVPQAWHMPDRAPDLRDARQQLRLLRQCPQNR